MIILIILELTQLGGKKVFKICHGCQILLEQWISLRLNPESRNLNPCFLKNRLKMLFFVVDM